MAKDNPLTDAAISRICQTTKGSIGAVNGPWAKLFKLTLAAYALLFAPVLTWGTWMTVAMWEVKQNGSHSMSVPMIVEAQDELAKKNPGLAWLDAREIQEIWKNHRE